MLAAYHQMCLPTTSSSTVSTSRRADALLPTGSIHLAGQGRPGYNTWKRITGAQSTRCGHRRRITRCGGRYGPRWSGAAVSEWVSKWSLNSKCVRVQRPPKELRENLLFTNLFFGKFVSEWRRISFQSIRTGHAKTKSGQDCSRPLAEVPFNLQLLYKWASTSRRMKNVCRITCSPSVRPVSEFCEHTFLKS